MLFKANNFIISQHLLHIIKVVLDACTYIKTVTVLDMAYNLNEWETLIPGFGVGNFDLIKYFLMANGNTWLLSLKFCVFFYTYLSFYNAVWVI